MSDYYEIHVTLKAQPEKHAEWEDRAKIFKIKTSFIVGDPLLGKDGFFYLTAHAKTLEDAKHEMDIMHGFGIYVGGQVVREKIEHVVYDTKRKLLQ